MLQLESRYRVKQEDRGNAILLLSRRASFFLKDRRYFLQALAPASLVDSLYCIPHFRVTEEEWWSEWTLICFLCVGSRRAVYSFISIKCRSESNYNSHLWLFRKGKEQTLNTWQDLSSSQPFSGSLQDIQLSGTWLDPCPHLNSWPFWCRWCIQLFCFCTSKHSSHCDVHWKMYKVYNTLLDIQIWNVWSFFFLLFFFKLDICVWL